MTELNQRETQVAIKQIKDYFERKLAEKLNLIRVSAPLFVTPHSGLNDNLTGVEKAVSFEMRKYNERIEIVQSLAKWKRMALKWYEFNIYEGLYADMNAIRPDETLDSIHSIYVDQWDWEKIIKKSDRTTDYLVHIVKDIYDVFKETENYINGLYPEKFTKKLPDNIKFITSQELEDLYPSETPEEREYSIVKEYGAVFISKIGGVLTSGISHGTRSPDYDDWDLNGDIIFWNPATEGVLELSSMGIRVDKEALEKQLKVSGAEERRKLDYHKKLLNEELPYTIGGGIGQSRICMFFLEKKHIGEVQASVWTDEILEDCRKNNIFLL
ncbi:aspartate--ammonia ligase [Tissierella sp. MB52-C2]|uniref:aspartate--ammonia ligase n=1 Tax=Tissierella sp. MB52-C2 TaxID=3070999 RepID=UPI00280BA722|nr:aspartate--ammonia ligase [Tissierella sp. MB52-C2]WMM26852.1 aspartate--ammonia ligase [Tissierella sp. MB52-C2]